MMVNPGILAKKTDLGSLSLAVATIVAAVGLSSSPVLAGDPFTGQWGGDCTPKAQCWLEISNKKKGKNYDVVFVAADRLNAAKVLCRVPFKMQRGQVLYSVHENYNDALGGEIKGSPSYVAANSDGSLILGGGMKAGLACDRYAMQQVFYPMGD